MTAFARMLLFQTRSLLGTSFFVFTALSSPVSFCLLKVLGSAGAASTGELWTLTLMSGVWGSTVTATGIIGYQRFQGTLEYLILSPLPAPLVFYPVMLSAVGVGAVVGLPTSLALSAAVGAVPTLSAATVLGAVLVVVSCACLAPLLAVPFLYARNSESFESLLLMGVWMLSGAVVRVDTLPQVVRVVAHISPLTWAVDVCLAGAGDVLLPALACLGLCAACSAIGLALLSAVVRRCRVTGSMGLA